MKEMSDVATAVVILKRPIGEKLWRASIVTGEWSSRQQQPGQEAKSGGAIHREVI